MFHSDIARFVREYSPLQKQWQLADFEEFYFFEESYFAIFSSRGVQNSVDMGSETHPCAVGPV